MKSWQKLALALLGIVIALPTALFWWLGYAMSNCGPNQTLYMLIGFGVLAAAVAAQWVVTARSRTGTNPLLLFGTVVVICLYMLFGRMPGC